MPVRLNIQTGDRFGRLTVVEEVEKRRNRRHFLCRCDCGGTAISSVDNLNGGHTNSCGCYSRDRIKAIKTTHGETGNRLYVIWQSMKKRCLNSKNHAYKYYGGRGIRVCDEWLSYEAFRDWAAASGYRSNLTIERINSNGNYEPNNCSWIPLSEQNNNKSNGRLLEKDGQIKSLRDWASQYDLSYQTLHGRLANGWDVNEAITTKAGAFRHDRN